MSKLYFPWLLLSYLIAAAMVVKLAMGGAIIYDFEIPLLWLLVSVPAMFIYRQRGLWFLIGAPFALIPATLVGLYLYACMPKSCL